MSQVADVDVDDVGPRVVVEPPDLGEQLLAGEDLARLPHERLEQRELPCAEVDGAFAPLGTLSDDARLVLVEVTPADGWSYDIDDDDYDEIEFTLRSGDESWDVEIELDDGQVELELDHEVETTVDR